MIGVHKFLSGTTVTVKAVAYEGFKFVKWSDGVFDTVRTDTYISNFNVQAIYEKIN